jgi:hypothetical protein
LRQTENDIHRLASLQEDGIKYATARNMKAKGLAADLIADVTGLSIDEVEKM